MKKEEQIRLEIINQALLRLMHFCGEEAIVYSFFDEDKNLLQFTTNKKIDISYQGKNVTLYKSQALPLYLISRILLFPQIDEFIIILIETRTLRKHSEKSYAAILELTLIEYKLLEQGARRKTKEKKKEIQQKLNMIASSLAEIFEGFLHEVGGLKNYDK